MIITLYVNPSQFKRGLGIEKGDDWLEKGDLWLLFGFGYLYMWVLILKLSKSFKFESAIFSASISSILDIYSVTVASKCSRRKWLEKDGARGQDRR